jgi:hypothetical protein
LKIAANELPIAYFSQGLDMTAKFEHGGHFAPEIIYSTRHRSYIGKFVVAEDQEAG